VHSPESSETRNGNDVQQAESQQDAANGGADIAYTAVVFTLCDVDLPCVVFDGELYVQAPIQDVFDAFAAYVSESLSNLETRVSETRSTALALDGIQRSLFGAPVALTRVVRGSEQ
jgi:hypothetical protein